MVKRKHDEISQLTEQISSMSIAGTSSQESASYRQSVTRHLNQYPTNNASETFNRYKEAEEQRRAIREAERGQRGI